MKLSAPALDSTGGHGTIELCVIFVYFYLTLCNAVIW